MIESAGIFEYATAPEGVRPTLRDRYGHFIGGAFVEPAEGEYFRTINPATEEVIAEVAEGSKADVDRAVNAAREALPAWSALPGVERAKYIYRIARRVQELSRELAVAESMDGGKPIRESRDVDVPLAAQHFFYYAGWADKLGYAFAGGGKFVGIGEDGAPLTPALSPGGEREQRHRVISPVGVCGQVIPWNFPLLMASWKLGPALAAGNTCVLKPAETTPLTALMLAEIFEEVELPAGVVNIVTGAGATGAAVVEHPGVNKVAFTGSTEVGKKIAHAIAGTGKKLTLELGGKSPNIVFEDASIDQAVEGIVQGIYFNQGHVCCAGSRVFVQESVAGEVIAKLKRRMGELRVGDPLDKNTDVGAINSAAQLSTIERYIDAGKSDGGAFWQAGGGVPSSGYWCRPCLFEGVQPSAVVAREEIFGPVLAVMTFRTPAEAIQRANNTPYGLAAGVWTDKGSKIFEIAKWLDAGVVWLNTYNKFDAASPFGGFKESGFGREGGVHGLRSYVTFG